MNFSRFFFSFPLVLQSAIDLTGFINLSGLCVLFAFPGCMNGPGQRTNSGPPVAKVYDKVLYGNDLAGLIKPGTSPEDSAENIRQFINEWVNDNLMVHYVESSLYNDEKLAETDRLTSRYRYSLLLYAYQRSIFEKFLDTTITVNEIKEYVQTRFKEEGNSDTALVYRGSFIKLLLIEERKKQILERAISNLHDEALADNAIEIFN